MIQQRRFSLPLAMALATFAVASLALGRSLSGDERSANAARTRAEIERKSRDIKKTVEDQQRKVRERLNLPDPTSGGPAGPKTAPPSSAGALRKNRKLPDPGALAKSPPTGMKKNSVEYSPKRGQEFAFLV